MAQITGHLAALEDTRSFPVVPSTCRPMALARAAPLAAWQAIDSGRGAVKRDLRH
jgi:hypothetical protein